MGHRELIESLQREAEEKAMTIWQEAEARAEALRAEAEGKIELIKQHYLDMQSSAVKAETEDILREAEGRARAIRLSAENELLKRLHSIARSSLGLLRDGGYEDAFRALYEELPPCKWQTVRVNPDDRRLALKYFPGAEIIPDRGITGGMDVEAEDGRIRVINTFDKRPEKAWPDMVPSLMRDVYKQIQGHRTP